MTYYVAQVVYSAMSEGNTYVQVSGPDQGKPVVRGIVTAVHEEDFVVNVWWEGCDYSLYCTAADVSDDPTDGEPR